MACGIRKLHGVVVLAAVLLPAWRAVGQTDPGTLLFTPWTQGQAFQNNIDATVENDGHVKENGLGLRLDTYESQGRWRMEDAHQINPTLGYDVFWLDINSRDPRLPRHLMDSSIAFATPIASVGNWFVAASGGVGYAGSAPYAQSDAYYGRFTAFVGRQFDKNTSLIFGLDYNGNRTEFPDVPIPGFAYVTQLHSTLKAEIGFPYTTIWWNPTDALTVEADYSFPSTMTAEVSYKLTGHLGLFANYAFRDQAFHVDGLPADNRLIFKQQRVETGLRYDLNEHVSLLAGVGYAFGTHFEVGFDERGAGTLLKGSDEGYLRLGLQMGW